MDICHQTKVYLPLPWVGNMLKIFWCKFAWHIIHWSQNLMSMQQKNELRQHLAQHCFVDRSITIKLVTHQVILFAYFCKFDHCNPCTKWLISGMPDINDFFYNDYDNQRKSWSQFQAHLAIFDDGCQCRIKSTVLSPALAI